MQIRMTKEIGKEFAVFTCDGPQVGVVGVQPAETTQRRVDQSINLFI